MESDKQYFNEYIKDITGTNPNLVIPDKLNIQLRFTADGNTLFLESYDGVELNECVLKNALLHLLQTWTANNSARLETVNTLMQAQSGINYMTEQKLLDMGFKNKPMYGSSTHMETTVVALIENLSTPPKPTRSCSIQGGRKSRRSKKKSRKTKRRR